MTIGIHEIKELQKDFKEILGIFKEKTQLKDKKNLKEYENGLVDGCKESLNFFEGQIEYILSQKKYN